MRKNIKIKKRDYKLEPVDLDEVINIDKFQAGGTYKVPVYQPFNYQLSPVKLNYNQPQTQALAAPKVDIPEIDFESLQKLEGKGHTNDVNAYIQKKQAAQQRLKEGISKYGVEFSQTPEFNTLVNSMTVSPNELNELIVRREMSKEFAAINKANGGENEWVTDANGSILVKDASTDGYKYASAYDVTTNENLVPITSADAIQLNDRDPKLAGNALVMQAVSQVWGGQKTLDHINSQMSNLGKSQVEQARESLGRLGNIKGSDVFGSNSVSQASSSNLKNIQTLAKSLMGAMDQGAMNYFRTQAIQQIGRVKASPEEYNKIVQAKTQDLLWQYMAKAIDTSSSSKQSLTIDAQLTKGIAGGAGFEPPEGEDIRNYIGMGISIQRNSDGTVAVADGFDPVRLSIYDAKTGKYKEVDAANYNRGIDKKFMNAFRPEIGSSLGGRQVSLIPGKNVVLKGGMQTNKAPQIIEYIDSNGDNQTMVKNTGLYTKADLEGITVQVRVKKDDGTFAFEQRPIINSDGNYDETVMAELGGQIVSEDDGYLNFGSDSKEEVSAKLQSEFGIPKDLADAKASSLDGALANTDGLFEIPYFSPYKAIDVHQGTLSTKVQTGNLAKYEGAKLNQAYQQSQSNDAWMGSIDNGR